MKSCSNSIFWYSYIARYKTFTIRIRCKVIMIITVSSFNDHSNAFLCIFLYTFINERLQWFYLVCMIFRSMFLFIFYIFFFLFEWRQTQHFFMLILFLQITQSDLSTFFFCFHSTQTTLMYAKCKRTDENGFCYAIFFVKFCVSRSIFVHSSIHHRKPDKIYKLLIHNQFTYLYRRFVFWSNKKTCFFGEYHAITQNQTYFH